MSPDALLSLSRTLAVVALLVMAVQLAWFALRGRVRARQMVRARLQRAAEVSPTEQRDVGLSGGRYERLAMKAGVRYSDERALVVVSLFTIVVAVIFAIFGPLIALASLVGGCAFVALIWNFLYQRQRRTIFDALPEIVDDVVRSIDAGRSLESALSAALREANPVFSPLAFRLNSAVESGRDYTHLLDDFADMYQVPPLVFVAVALRTSSRFGSSIRPILRQVSEAVRSQQEMRREFLSATAETRFTAVIFAIMPLGIGAYVMAMNEGFRDILLNTPTGNRLLMISIGLVAVGTAIIFKMIQGVGRG